MTSASGDDEYFFVCLWRSSGPALHQLNRKLRRMNFVSMKSALLSIRSNIFSLFHHEECYMRTEGVFIRSKQKNSRRLSISMS
ncbi:hypothetical protein P3S67_017658 [Capsicum chacoense]